MIPNLTKTLAVIVSSTILATLAVNAFDMRGHIVTSFLASIFFSQDENTITTCPEDMVLVTQALDTFCIDKYEVSPSKDCVYPNPHSQDETVFNIADSSCEAVSMPMMMPWTYVTKAQAELLCERAGKRLPTANEWYKAALGTPDPATFSEDGCNLARNRADGVDSTGAGMRCVSNAGAYDMVGNVWEWVTEVVQRGVYGSTTLPHTGYVQDADTEGVATQTGSAQSDDFSYDRFWVDSSIVAGIMRGGYFDSKTDGGVFALYAASPTTFSGGATGFRCVMDIHND